MYVYNLKSLNWDECVVVELKGGLLCNLDVSVCNKQDCTFCYY